MNAVFSAKAPAKLIISGEHAVVYGAPAIAVAINQYITTTVNWSNSSTFNSSSSSNKYNSPIINFNLVELKYAKAHPIKTLLSLAHKLQHNYNAFLNNSCSIKQVIKKPFELMQYAVINLLAKLQLQISKNLDIKVDSNIPIGAGLGSSAAVIISCLRSLAYLFTINWDPNKFLKIAKDIEHLQHGYSSGLDLYMSTFGGCNYFNFANDIVKPIAIDLPKLGCKIVHTGIPAATTGECVISAKEYFINNHLDLVNKFTLITETIRLALINNDQLQLINAIRANHNLLCSIKVVPEKIQHFIKDIELIGGAGKICGAGSISGDSAGILLVIGDEIKLTQIAADYNYKIQNIHMDLTGVTVV